MTSRSGGSIQPKPPPSRIARSAASQISLRSAPRRRVTSSIVISVLISAISGPPAQEIGDQGEAGGLALLRMELGADQIVAPDHRGDRPAIGDPRQFRAG